MEVHHIVLPQPPLLLLGALDGRPTYIPQHSENSEYSIQITRKRIIAGTTIFEPKSKVYLLLKSWMTSIGEPKEV